MDYRTYPCPSCLQVIDNTMRSCKFCGAPIDPATATAAAALQEQVQKACFQAGAMRRFAMAMPVLFLLSFFPTIGILSHAAEDVALLLLPLNVILWRKRFGKLEVSDPDLARARRALTEAARWWAAMAIVNVLWWFLFRHSLVGFTRY